MSETKSLGTRVYTRRDFLGFGLGDHSLSNAESPPGGGERMVSLAGRIPDRSPGNRGDHRSSWRKAYGRIAIASSGCGILATGALIMIRVKTGAW
jgi:hypothetical protein